MAENVKQIQEFPQKTDFGDDDLLLIQGSGTTYNVQGRAVKKYAEDAAKPQVELAVGQAQAAAEAANRAEAAIVHPPIPDPATGNWMRWDQLTEEYVVTDIRAEGQDFEIRGFYPSFEALQEAVPDPKKGWAYGIGTEAPYEIYVWDAVGGDWKNNGPMAATGDMMRSTYDPQHKNKDIFDYADGVGLPPGGTVGQIPSITAESPRVVEWQDPPEGVGRSMAGKTVEPTLGTTVTAGEGAEIFNDYRDRSFNEESENPLQGNISSGKHSHSEGQVTTASGNSSHAENYQTIASGNFSHAEGRLSKSVGAISHAEGYQTTAGGSCSHAEGSGTTASGYCSHAEGNGTTASGNESHAAGYGTVAEYATETVVGSYNVRHSDAQNHENFKDKFVVGIGFSEGSRSNAFRVSYDGVYSMKQIASSGAD